MKSRALILVACIALALSPIAAQAASFAGKWNFSLKTTKDACGLGNQGKTQAVNGVVVKQKGSKATLTIQGVKFAAKVSGSSLKGSGSYSTSGLKLSGTIKATLKGRTKMSIPSTKITIKAGSKSCYLLMKGSGVKVG